MYKEAAVRWGIERGFKASIKDDIRMLQTIGNIIPNDISNLRPSQIYSLRTSLKNKNLSNASINRHFAVLKSVLNAAANEWGWNVKVPKIKMLPEKARDRVLTTSEEDRLLCALKPPYRDMAIFTLETGLRWHNVAALKKTFIDFKGCAINFPASEMKSQRPLTIPISEKAAEIIDRNMSDDKYIFGNVGQLQSKYWAQVLKEADIQDFRWHDLRHTYATRKAQGGMPIDILSKFLGHTTITTTERYRHLNITDLRKYI